MAETPQYKNTQPILNVQNVNSGAESYEAFAKTLGQIGQSAAETVNEIHTDQSNASLLQTATQADTIKSNAQIEMLKHPEQAQKIADQSATLLDTLNQTAYVNKQDRTKLASLTAGDFNTINVHAAEVMARQAQKGLSISYWDQYPVTMRNIQQALDSGDFTKAKIYEESLHKASLDAAKLGAISPEQYSSVRKSS